MMVAGAVAAVVASSQKMTASEEKPWHSNSSVRLDSTVKVAFVSCSRFMVLKEVGEKRRERRWEKSGLPSVEEEEVA